MPGGPTGPASYNGGVLLTGAEACAPRRWGKRPVGRLEGKPESCRREHDLLTLLCLSRADEWFHRPGELPVEFAGDVALEAAADLSRGLSLGGAPGDVGAGAGAA